MSYQVLARKWRPKSFREMAGQNHVLKALINALDHDRLHHAYLFTGTRGVGKTTIARILAKCLNCESGVSSEPCGQCQSCVAIAEGRFVDLIEVDAASRTKVEDTRELLDNVQYTPSQGRYKVYLIDEVHMLSGSSFNALLKTLEEPPPHVKFLLATTDPQKIPATILSRCLQFSLKNLSPERVVDYLKTVLDKEMIQYEEPALWLLGRAADGSMRDALSLTDQGIAFGSGKLLEHDIRQMLGTIDHNAVYRLLEALRQRDAAGLMAVVSDIVELGVDPAAVVSELLSVFHRLALAQVLPEGLDNSLGDRQRLLDMAKLFPAEDVQFFYQLCLSGRRDFGLSPDPRAALEMLLLRLLAFCPEGVEHTPNQQLPGDAAVREAAEPEKKPLTKSSEPPLRGLDILAAKGVKGAPPEELPGKQSSEVQTEALTPAVSAVEPRPSGEDVQYSDVGSTANELAYENLNSESWRQQFDRFAMPGMLGNIASHCQIAQKQDHAVTFMLDAANAALLNERHTERLSELLSQFFDRPLTVSIDVGTVTEETPADYRQRCNEQRLQETRDALKGDPIVNSLIVEFDAVLDDSSVQFVDDAGSK